MRPRPAVVRASRYCARIDDLRRAVRAVRLRARSTDRGTAGRRRARSGSGRRPGARDGPGVVAVGLGRQGWSRTPVAVALDLDLDASGVRRPDPEPNAARRRRSRRDRAARETSPPTLPLRGEGELRSVLASPLAGRGWGVGGCQASSASGSSSGSLFGAFQRAVAAVSVGQPLGVARGWIISSGVAPGPVVLGPARARSSEPRRQAPAGPGAGSPRPAATDWCASLVRSRAILLPSRAEVAQDRCPLLAAQAGEPADRRVVVVGAGVDHVVGLVVVGQVRVLALRDAVRRRRRTRTGAPSCPGSRAPRAARSRPA